MTLHEAIKIVLLNANKPLKALEIAKIINDQKLYIRNDNQIIPGIQINARVKQYPEIFKTNSDFTISLIASNVIDLLQLKNRDLLKSLRRANLSDSFILPLLYFFKRIIDNPEQFSALLKKTGPRPECTRSGFLLFLAGLNNSETAFNSRLHKIIENFTLNGNENENFDIIFRELDQIELLESNVSKDQFNNFFSSVLNYDFNNPHKGAEYSTPVEIIDVLSILAHQSSGKVFYNPFAGYCSLAVSVLSGLNSNYSFYGEEINSQIYLKGLINLVLNGVDTSNFYNSDSFDQINMHFADLCISNPPFTDFQPNSGRYNPLNENLKTRDFILNAIQLIIGRLNPAGGRAIIVVPENLLFSNSKTYTEFRKKLISDNLIESVISLPSSKVGYFSNMKTSLLVLNKSKFSRSIIFFDYLRFDTIHKINKQDKSEPKILFNIYYGNLLDNLNKPILDPIDQLFVNIVTLKKGENKLVVARQMREQGQELEDVSVKRLKDVCGFVNYNLPSSTELVYFIKISDLNKNYYDYKLNTSNLNLVNAKGKIISQNAILVGCIVGSLKPTFFELDRNPVAISNDVYAISIKEEFISKIDPEYLIYELSSDYVLSQIEKFSTGVTSLKRIPREDLMNIRIKIPPLAEQKAILKNKKDALYAANIFDNKVIEESTDINTLDEKEILGFVNHELGNIKGAIINDLNNLKSFIRLKSDKQELITLDSRITSRSVSDIIDGLTDKFENITSIMNTIQNILSATKESLALEPVKIKDFISQQVKSLDEYCKDFHVVYSGEELFETKDFVIKLDKKQFALVIQNFIINSYKHGYDEDKKYKNLVFDVSEDDDNIYIDMINDGKPFEKDFTLSDFIGFGLRRSAQKGSGLGGYLMNRVIENHSGKLELMEPSSFMVISNPVDDPHDIIQRLIIPGVHFRINLPKYEK
jgi:type I restriction enzyme M protein